MTSVSSSESELQSSSSTARRSAGPAGQRRYSTWTKHGGPMGRAGIDGALNLEAAVLGEIDERD